MARKKDSGLLYLAIGAAALAAVYFLTKKPTLAVASQPVVPPASGTGLTSVPPISSIIERLASPGDQGPVSIAPVSLPTAAPTLNLFNPGPPDQGPYQVLI